MSRILSLRLIHAMHALTSTYLRPKRTSVTGVVGYTNLIRRHVSGYGGVNNKFGKVCSPSTLGPGG